MLVKSLIALVFFLPSFAFASSMDASHAFSVGYLEPATTQRWVKITPGAFGEENLSTIIFRAQYQGRTCTMDFYTYDAGSIGTLQGQVTATQVIANLYGSSGIPEGYCTNTDGCYIKLACTSSLAWYATSQSSPNTNITYNTGGRYPAVYAVSVDDAGGGGESSTTTIYESVNSYITATNCTTESATSTGMSTTTCTNTVATSSVSGTDLTETNNILSSAFLTFVWFISFILIFYLFISFIKSRYGHY